MRLSAFRVPRRAHKRVIARGGAEQSRFGIGLGVLAYALFAVHDAAIKWLVGSIPTWEVLFVRSVVVCVACIAIGGRGLIERAVETPLKPALVFRGLITLVAWICYFTAARYLPLAQLLSLYFAAPLMVTALAAPLLGERVTGIGWLAVLVGFAGVMVETDPWGVRPSIPTLLVLVAAGIWSYAIILMRRIALRESSLLQIAYVNAVMLVGTGLACTMSWRPPTPAQCALLALVALFGGLGQFSLFEAARRAPAAVMATLEYSALIWAFVLGYAVWGDIPSGAVFAGAALIALAGIMLFLPESRLRRLFSRARS